MGTVVSASLTLGGLVPHDHCLGQGLDGRVGTQRIGDTWHVRGRRVGFVVQYDGDGVGYIPDVRR